MHPSQRFSYALVISLALWWPTLQGALGGGVDPLDASVKWVLAFLVATIGVRLLGGLVDRYAGGAEPATLELDADDDRAGV